MAVKVFVAGATGAIGRRLVPLLVAKGYEVFAMTLSPDKAPALAATGAAPVVADGLDRAMLMRAVETAQPDVIVHEMTGLRAMGNNFRRFDDEFALTNRLRTEGTDNLLAAARAVGARRFVAQSYGNWNYARIGTSVKTEDDPLDPDPPANQRESLAAIRHVEDALLASGIEGIALRYGNLYGPGTGFADDGAIVELVRKRRLPIIGDGGGVWSFVHVDDAATATVAAIEGGAPGFYNIVDDEPARVSVWLPELARIVGARPPWHVPVWLGRLLVGEVGISMMTQIRGASNAKAERELGWRPHWRTWADGFRDSLGDIRLAA